MAARPAFISRAKARGVKFRDAVRTHAVMLGNPLTEWQDLAVDKLARFSKGTPAYPDLLISVPRQQGKTILAKAWASAWADEFPGSNMVYMAQTLMDARDRVLELGDQLVAAGVPVKVRLSVARTAIEWPNGSKVWAAGPSEKALHGASLDLVIADEVWALPERVLGAIIPARGARPNSQMVMISTAGVRGQSDVMERFRNLGMDPESGVGLAEWSCPDDVDPFVPSNWGKFMPAFDEPWFNHRGVDQSLRTLSNFDFRRYYGNQWTDAIEEVIPADWWEPTRLDVIEQGRPVVFAFDAQEQPAGASVAACFPYDDGAMFHVELAAHKSGESMLWVLEEVKRLVTRHRPAAVCGAGASMRGITAEIKQWCDEHGVPFKQANNYDLVGSAMLLSDSLRTKTVTHGSSMPLDYAQPRVVRKQQGDGWKFDKIRSTVDVSPLTAVSLALLTAREYQDTAEPRIY